MTDKLTVKEVRELFKQVESPADPLFAHYAQDSRAGVAKVIEQTQRRLKKEAAARAAFRGRFRYENELWQQGIKYVAGMDEVGRATRWTGSDLCGDLR